MSKWTPPLWTPQKQGNGQWFVMASSGYPVCRVSRWEKENDKADAHMIAAAPTLYDALLDLDCAVREIQGYETPNHIPAAKWDRLREADYAARAALSLARGESTKGDEP